MSEMVSYLPQGSGHEAVAIDTRNREVQLRCGQVLPVVRYYSMDGEQVHECELDLHDDLAVVAGPMPDGRLLLCTVRTPLAGIAMPRHNRNAQDVRVQ